MAGTPRDPSNDHTRRPVDLSEESVAGEEDPGASIDVTVLGGADAAPCPHCAGSGRHGSQACPACQGSGKAPRP